MKVISRKALQLALVAAHLQTEDPEGWRRVAILALDSNDDGTAKDALDRVLRMDPSDCAALGDLAQSLGRMGNMPKRPIGATHSCLSATM